MKDPQEPVIFRIDNKSGIPFAIFPYITHYATKVLCYCPLGQHFGANYDFHIRHSTPAKPEEYKSLYDELIAIGYRLRIIRRACHRKMYKNMAN